MEPVNIIKFETVEPTIKEPGYFYALRMIEYTDNNISNIIEKEFYHSTPMNEAIRDLIVLSKYNPIGVEDKYEAYIRGCDGSEWSEIFKTEKEAIEYASQWVGGETELWSYRVSDDGINTAEIFKL